MMETSRGRGGTDRSILFEGPVASEGWSRWSYLVPGGSRSTPPRESVGMLLHCAGALKMLPSRTCQTKAQWSIIRSS